MIMFTKLTLTSIPTISALTLARDLRMLTKGDPSVIELPEHHLIMITTIIKTPSYNDHHHHLKHHHQTFCLTGMCMSASSSVGSSESSSLSSFVPGTSFLHLWLDRFKSVRQLSKQARPLSHPPTHLKFRFSHFLLLKDQTPPLTLNDKK